MVGMSVSMVSSVSAAAEVVMAVCDDISAKLLNILHHHQHHHQHHHHHQHGSVTITSNTDSYLKNHRETLPAAYKDIVQFTKHLCVTNSESK